MFYFRHHNRLTYPQKHILICEDNLTNQKNILDHLISVFEPEGLVQFSVVPGALAAAALITQCKIDVILLDHDMPEGNGTDLLNWMKSNNCKIPVITFSGIPQNNTHMISLGANYLFNKYEVTTGKADQLIKILLGMNSGLAEIYDHPFCRDFPKLERYWITPKILVGGNIVSTEDWKHLERDFGIRAVINADFNTDKNYGISNLLECPVHDNGDMFPADKVKAIVEFAKIHIHSPMYVHCHAGMSRSPHFTYIILRTHYGMTKEDALKMIREILPTPRHLWGFDQHTAKYVESIEQVLAI